MIIINLLDHTEGAGSLYQMYVSAWILCKIYNKKYIHNIPLYIHHYKSNNCELDDFINDWESMFAFLENEEREDEDEDEDEDGYEYEEGEEVEIVEMGTNLNTFKKLSNSLYYYITNTKQLFDEIGTNEQNIFDLKIKNILRERFHKKTEYIPRNILWDYEHKIINIAIHIRNLNDEDVIRDKRSKTWELFTYDYGKNLNHNIQGKYYKNLITKISDSINRYNCIKILENGRESYKKFHFHFHIFSQGSIEQFKMFQNIDNTCVHLNNYALDDFWHFTNADILIIAKSSFSYLASLFNKNIKIIKNPFRHHLPSETIIMNKKTYNSSYLEKEIFKYLVNKDSNVNGNR